MHLLVIGGSDAGMSAGLRAREGCDGVDVTVVVADAYPNFSVCGLPYYVSGETPDWHQLAHRTQQELEAAGLAASFDPLTAETAAWDHKAYYPGAELMRQRVTGDRQSGQLLGAQIFGPWQAEVAKRIDVYAVALYPGMTVETISDLDLSYTPPFGSPWDAIQIAAQGWDRAWAGERA